MTNEEAIRILHYDIEVCTEEQADACLVAIKALDQQPSEDAVSREQVEEITFQEPSYTDPYNILTEVREKVRALPPVQPQRKRGKWIYTPKRRLIDETDEGCVYITDYRCTCSECGGDFGFQKMSDAYCKYCGAKMEGKEDENNSGC